jgi:hypothetical protein
MYATLSHEVQTWPQWIQDGLAYIGTVSFALVIAFLLG